MTERISTERRAEIYAEKVAVAFGIGSPEDRRELYLHFLEACQAEAADERETCAALVDKAADALAQGCYYANPEGLHHLAFLLRQRGEQP